VEQANGDHIVLLNNDTEVLDGGWLEAMLEHSQRPEVGAVGARLLYPMGSCSMPALSPAYWVRPAMPTECCRATSSDISLAPA
jgi:GT2 family glycosyltransferase